MTDCSTDLKRTVPLYRAVYAAIIDSHEDIGKVEQMFSHWAARELKNLDRQTLKQGLRRVILHVNRNTNTATLPPDFGGEIGVALINSSGDRRWLKVRPEITNSSGIEEIPCEDKCEKCNQDKAICADLAVTESVELVLINGNPYERTITKKLYPSGEYYVETKIPVLNIESNAVEYQTTKEFVAELSLKSCGCLEDTEENLETLKCCCPDVYYSYYSGCENSCTSEDGGYRIFEESGLIQLDNVGRFSKVYMEYWGFMPKKNGQYQVPEIAFEAIVEGIKYRYIKNKRWVNKWEKDDAKNNYKEACANMRKIMGRISLSQIIQAIGLVPKFDLSNSYVDSCGCLSTTNTTQVVPVSSGAGVVGDSDSDSSDNCGTGGVASATCKCLSPFQLAVVAGNGSGTPDIDSFVYQNDALKNAVGLNFILVNNSPETILGGSFTFDASTGTITRVNQWFQGDVLVVPYAKYVL